MILYSSILKYKLLWSSCLNSDKLLLSDEVVLPCKPNGGSPFMHIAFSCIPSSLFTGWGHHYYTRFRLFPKGKTVYSSVSPHRVECPSTKTSTKDNLATLSQPPFPSLCIFSTNGGSNHA